MDHFAGLDVSVKETSICIVDDTGRITKEVKVAASLKPCRRFWGTRLQADRTGNWAAIAMAIQWLAEAGLPMVCVESGICRRC
jgi:transposase